MIPNLSDNSTSDAAGAAQTVDNEWSPVAAAMRKWQ